MYITHTHIHQLASQIDNYLLNLCHIHRRYNYQATDSDMPKCFYFCLTIIQLNFYFQPVFSQIEETSSQSTQFYFHSGFMYAIPFDSLLGCLLGSGEKHASSLFLNRHLLNKSLGVEMKWGHHHFVFPLSFLYAQK